LFIPRNGGIQNATVNEPGKRSFIPQNDGIENGKFHRSGKRSYIAPNGGIEMEEPIGKVTESGKSVLIPQVDGIENDDYVIEIELSASNMLMFAAMICIVVTVITVVILCQRSGDKHVVYRKVVVHSDSDLEAERLK